MKGDLEKYKEILTGKFTYEKPNSNMNSIYGYLKLKKNPRAEDFTIQNMILAGSIIKCTDWYILNKYYINYPFELKCVNKFEPENN
jgi:hypothetical protein